MGSIALPLESFEEVDANRNSEIYGGSLVLIALSTTFVVLRLLSRWMAKANLWWDDYIVIISLLFSWGPNILNMAGIHFGFGKHLYSLSLPTIVGFFKLLYAFEFLWIFAMAGVKFSIILFQYRIFPIQHYRRFLVVLAIFISCLTVSTLLVCIFQCIPISGFWTTFAGDIPGAKCVNVVRFFLVSGSINAATDFIILALPIPILWKLRTGTLQKLILTCIFSIGLLVCSVSIVRLVLLAKFSQDDITWNYVTPAIWTAAEPSIGVISACLPSLRPLFAKLVWGRGYRPKMLSSTLHSGHSRSNNGLGYASYGWRSAAGYYPDGKGGGGAGARDLGFNRLQDRSLEGSGEFGAVGGGGAWRHKALVKGGRGSDDLEGDEFGVGGGGWDGGGHGVGYEEEPKNGIRVRTTVTVTEKVDWLDDLY